MIKTEEPAGMDAYTVAEVALAFPHAISVLHRYGLDYSFKGKKKFTQACEKLSLVPEQVWQEILAAAPATGKNKPYPFRNWEANLLIDFIIQHHHGYLRTTIPQITELLQTICSVHGDDKPELSEIRTHFEALSTEMLHHLPKEEDVLFPAIRRVAHGTGIVEESPLLHNVKSSILAMEHEHSRAGELIRLIRELSNNYTPPEYACPTFRLAFQLLEEFEHDVLQHIHLENNILFPKVNRE
jgi:regulator of cell morphogenesis and NO signaling